jgi:hypothetical protein
MSDHSHTPELKADFFDKRKATTLAAVFGGVGIVGLLLSLGLGLGDTKQFAFSWLFAVVYFFAIACGALFWTFVHYATDAEWSVIVRRQLENVATLIPFIGVFFIAVLAFFAPLLFSWWTMKPGVSEVFDHKAGYLNPTFFIGRAIFYFVALGILGFLIRRNSVKQDEDGHPGHTVRSRVLSFIGIPAVGLSLTFAAVDWLMSLDYHWFSTMWGVYIFAGGVGAAMGTLVLIVTWLRSNGHLKGVTIEHYHIMGKLMLAFCVFWAYIGYSQYMLIWYANMPEETVYFIRRNTESWWYLSMALVIFRFFLPFPVLLFQATKKNPKWLCLVAAWLLIMQALDLYLVILPMLHIKGVNFSPLDATCFIGVGSTLIALFLWRLPKTNLFPARDPRLPESLRLTN